MERNQLNRVNIKIKGNKKMEDGRKELYKLRSWSKSIFAVIIAFVIYILSHLKSINERIPSAFQE